MFNKSGADFGVWGGRFSRVFRACGSCFPKKRSDNILTGELCRLPIVTRVFSDYILTSVGKS